MKEITAKEIEESFSKKQTIAFSKKMQRDNILLNQKYQQNLKYQESRIEKEVQRRLKIELEIALKEKDEKIKILMNLANIREDYIRRLLKSMMSQLKTGKKLTEAQIESISKISDLEQRNKELLQATTQQTKKIEQFESFFHNDGTTSSIPTSQTPIGKIKVNPNSRKKTENKKGGQQGHTKSKLQKFKEEEITIVENITLEECNHCQSKDIKETGKVVEKDEYQYRIIVDKIRHRYLEYVCNDCKKTIRKEIPNHLKEENQYGITIQSTALALMNIANVPINKVKRMIQGLTMDEINLSEGYISKLQKRTSEKLKEFIVELKKEILKLNKIYWDDTTIMVNTKRACGRFYGNEEMALYTAHEKKNRKGIDKDQILGLLNSSQNVIHDHLKMNYNSDFSFCNIECNAHLLRDLEKVSVNLTKRTWSKKLKEHIQTYEHMRKEWIENKKEMFTGEEINEFFMKFNECILLGYEENEADACKYYSDKEKALLKRLIEYRDNYTYWVLDFEIPFTNNLSERALRGIKSKMKVSGQFQNIKHAEYYMIIRSYIETCHRNGVNEVEALKRLLQGDCYSIEEIKAHKKISSNS